MPLEAIPSIRLLAALLGAASLAACANPRGEQEHGQHHPPQAAPGRTVPDQTGASSAQSSMMGGPGRTGAAGDDGPEHAGHAARDAPASHGHDAAAVRMTVCPLFVPAAPAAITIAAGTAEYGDAGQGER